MPELENEVLEPALQVSEGDAPAAAAPDPAPEPAAAPEVPIQKPQVPHSILERLSQESNRRRDETARAERAETEARNLRLMLEQAQKGTAPPASPDRQTAPQTQQDFDAAVSVGVQRRALADARNEVIGKGYQDFGKPKFDEAANVLAALGCTSDDFISDVLAVNRGDAHKLLAAIADDPEKAAHLSAIDSRSRIAELSRMNMENVETKKAAAAAPPPPKPVSNAPAPAPRVAPSGAPADADDLLDESISDDEFRRRYKKKYGF